MVNNVTIGTEQMTDEQLAMYNKLTTLQQNVAICRINMPLSSNAEVYKLGGGTAGNANSIDSTAHELLNNPAVVEFLDTFAIEKVELAVMTRDEIIKDLSFIAGADISDVAEFSDRECVDLEDGMKVWQSTIRVKSMKELTPLQRKLIKSVKQTKYGLELVLHDAMQARKQLAALQGFDAAKKLEITDNTPITEQVSDDEFKEQLKELGVNFD